MLTRPRLAFVGLLVGSVLAAAVSHPPARAADHGDAPFVTLLDGRRDINDLYVFQSPTTPSNTVLIMTVSPAAGLLNPTVFAPKADYRFLVDNNSNSVEDIVFTVRFAGQRAPQRMQVTGRGPGLRLSARGAVGQQLSLAGGGTVQAGLFDDPFFFDVIAFRKGLAFTDPGVDFFRGLNTLAIVLEVPTSILQVQSNAFAVWVTTGFQARQLDRMGRPAINTVLIPAAKKDLFNRSRPRNDRQLFRQDAVNSIMSLGRTQQDAEGLADFLLPDVMTYDPAAPQGFPNGRRLPDDVIDIELQLLTGSSGATDGVDANDRTFLQNFPYLASPN